MGVSNLSNSILSAGRRGAAGFILVGLAALLLPVAPAAAQDPARMDRIVQAAADRDEFSGSVLVARDGEVLLDKGYGFANREWRAPNDGDTRFRLASLTKQFTAVAILLLAERGQVDIEAPVKTYLPDAPAAWDRVTLRHLLNHTSGIPNYVAFPEHEALRMQPAATAELIARFRDRPLEFQPGERWTYSNSGYVLLTAVIERASGRSYAEFVAENLFQPLGMADSGYDSHAAIIPRRASGYVPTDRGVVNAAYVDMSVPSGSGGLYSTTHDLLKWEQGLFGGRLLRPESLALLTTPGLNDYALGLIVVEGRGRKLIIHNGSIDGFHTYMAYDAGDRTAVIVLSNIEGPASDRLGSALVTLARGGEALLPDERVAVVLAPEALRAYEGVYELGPDFALTLTATGGKLMVQATGQQAFELLAESPDAFFLRDPDAQITFTRDASGAIQGLVLHQNGRQMPARKK